jgi:hypothetical protein
MKRNDFILSLKQGFNMEHTLEPVLILSHSRQALLPCAVVYVMNLRIPPKPAIKAILKLKLVRAMPLCPTPFLNPRSYYELCEKG